MGVAVELTARGGPQSVVLQGERPDARTLPEMRPGSPARGAPLDQGALPAAPPDHGRRLDGVLPRLPRRGARLPLLPRRRRFARGVPQGRFGNRGDAPAPARSGAPEPYARGTGRSVRGPVGSARHRRGEAAHRRGVPPLHALEARMAGCRRDRSPRRPAGMLARAQAVPRHRRRRAADVCQHRLRGAAGADRDEPSRRVLGNAGGGPDPGWEPADPPGYRSDHARRSRRSSIPSVCGTDEQWSTVTIEPTDGRTCEGCGTFRRTDLPHSRNLSPAEEATAVREEHARRD